MIPIRPCGSHSQSQESFKTIKDESKSKPQFRISQNDKKNYLCKPPIPSKQSANLKKIKELPNSNQYLRKSVSLSDFEAGPLTKGIIKKNSEEFFGNTKVFNLRFELPVFKEINLFVITDYIICKVQVI